MHFPRQVRADTEAPFERLREAARWRQSHLCGYRFQRHLARQQHSRGIEPRRLDEACRRLASGFHELAVETSLAESGAGGKCQNIERGIEVAEDPRDQVRKRAIGLGLRLQQRAELRLVPWTSRIQHKS